MTAYGFVDGWHRAALKRLWCDVSKDHALRLQFPRYYPVHPHRLNPLTLMGCPIFTGELPTTVPVKDRTDADHRTPAGVRVLK